MVDIRALRGVNLNRLPVLWELLRCRNVSIAADNLGLTQSTVSASLKSLRELFEDELLVPAGRELVLTERAQELLPLLEATLNLVQDLVREPEFDPKSDETLFRISTADYVSTLFLPALMKALPEVAPRMSVQLVPPTKQAERDIKLGLLDLTIGPEQMVEWIDAQDQMNEYHFERCFEDSFVCISSRAAPAPTSVEAYLATPHASIQLQRGLPASLEHDVLLAQRHQQFNRLLVPEFWLLPFVVAQSEMISLIPRSMAALYRSIFDIEVFEPPMDFPPLRLCMLWKRGRERDARFSWFLYQVRAAFASRTSC